MIVSILNMYTKMVNIENIFSLFSAHEDLNGTNTTVHIDFTENPIYWVGMYKKMLTNNINFNKKLLQIIGKNNEDLDILDVKQAGEHIVFNRAWNYIKKIDINDVEHCKAIEKLSDEYLDTALELGIYYYEPIEAFEKCAHLKKILDKSKEFQT